MEELVGALILIALALWLLYIVCSLLLHGAIIIFAIISGAVLAIIAYQIMMDGALENCTHGVFEYLDYECKSIGRKIITGIVSILRFLSRQIKIFATLVLMIIAASGVFVLTFTNLGYVWA